MENRLIVTSFRDPLTRKFRPTSQRSIAYPSSPSMSRGGRFSSLSAGTPKLPLVPLDQVRRELILPKEIHLPSGYTLPKAGLKGRIECQFDGRVR